MICVYGMRETDFSHNGLCVLDSCISAEIYEELNGTYELMLEYPVDKAGKHLNLKRWNIIKADGQLFRIYDVERVNNNNLFVSVKARHIFYDLAYNFMVDKRAENGSLGYALSKVLEGTSFVGSSDVVKLETAYFVKENSVKAIFEKIIPRWGGEIKRDNYNITINQNRGSDRGVLVMYGKNITGIKEKVNIDEVVTRMYPTGFDGITLPEVYIDSPLINNAEYPPFPLVREVYFQDAEDETTLRTKAQALMDGGVLDRPSLAYDVNFVELSKTVEYKDYKVLERVYLGDFVTVRHSRFNIDVKLQVVSYRKDVLRDMMVEIRLGDKKKDLSNFLNNFSGVVDVLNGAFTEDGKVDASFLKGLINIATNLILSGNDGHVLIDENGINIMDTTDKMTAEKVWRWNLGGLGYSSTGYDGPFTTAITSTGLIVADFIGAGEIQGGLIKASTILGSAIKAGEITGQHIKADELVVGTNVKMGTGAVITWDSAGVNGVTPPTAGNVGARPYDWLPQYGEIQGTKPPSDADNTTSVIGENRLTYIDGQGIYTGTLTAQQINAIQGIMLGANAIIQWASLPSLPSADQVGARANTWVPTASQVGARPDTWMPTASQVGATTSSDVTVITQNMIASSVIKCDQITSYGVDPIIRLFGNTSMVSIDATSNNETGGPGTAIRLKWDRNNYIAVSNGRIDFYVGGGGAPVMTIKADGTGFNFTPVFG